MHKLRRIRWIQSIERINLMIDYWSVCIWLCTLKNKNKSKKTKGKREREIISEDSDNFSFSFFFYFIKENWFWRKNRMYKSVVAVYDGEKVIGDVEVYFNPHLMNLNMREKLKDKIRISYYSTPSERCSPLAVLHTITSPTTGVCLKMECSKTINSNSQLNLLHSTCLRENKVYLPNLRINRLTKKKKINNNLLKL